MEQLIQVMQAEITALTARVAELEEKLARIDGRLDERGRDDHDDHDHEGGR